jgi:hypothetical protein
MRNVTGGRLTGPALHGGFGRISRDASLAITHRANPAAGQEGKLMSDNQTVTIPAAEHAATAETRPARLLRALAQNPEPLSTPALASLLAEPGRRRRLLLSSYDRALRRHEQAGHVEQAGRERNKGRGRPAIIWRITTAGRGWLDDHDKAPALAAAAAAQARRAAAERDQALDQARATFTRQTPRISRKRAAHQLRELGCTLDQIGAVFHVSKERIRQDLLWDPAAGRPPRKPKPRKRLSLRQTPLVLGLSTSGFPWKPGHFDLADLACCPCFLIAAM